MYKTPQEIFNIAYIGIRDQGWKQSFNAHRGMCMYRGPNNTKCAIGHCIPDELYDPNFENEELPAEVAGIAKEDLMFAFELQAVHDNTEFPNMKNALELFAKSKGLTVPE